MNFSDMNMFTDYPACPLKMKNGIKFMGKRIQIPKNYSFFKMCMNKSMLKSHLSYSIFVVFDKHKSFIKSNVFTEKKNYITKFNFIFLRGPAILFNFNLSNYGECYQIDKNVKHVGSAWI